MSATLFQAGEVAAMAEITTHQLREWTARRAILAPDVPGRGRGKHALFSPATILVLRIVAELQERFRVEVGSLGPVAEALRAELSDIPFIGLYGRGVALASLGTYEIQNIARVRVSDAMIVIPFDKHLVSIAEKSGLRDQFLQFQLFPAISA